MPLNYQFKPVADNPYHCNWKDMHIVGVTSVGASVISNAYVFFISFII